MIYSESNQDDQYECQQIDTSGTFGLNEIEQPPSLTRKFVELLLYTAVLSTNFPGVSPLSNIP